jgi:hypothetical protein
MGRIGFSDSDIVLKRVVFDAKDSSTKEISSTYVGGGAYIVAEAPNGAYTIKYVVVEKDGKTYSLNFQRLGYAENLAELSDRDMEVYGEWRKAQLALARTMIVKNLQLENGDASIFSLEYGGFSYQKDDYKDILNVSDLGPYRTMLTRMIGRMDSE